jgi:NADH dehydrogenase [ubiquinone] 1 alpha subcomplex assembly factor 5
MGSGYDMNMNMKIIVDAETVVVNYADPIVLMQDLQGMGENNAILHRKHTLRRDTLIATAAAYKGMYGNEDGSVPATFHVRNFSAFKFNFHFSWKKKQ